MKTKMAIFFIFNFYISFGQYLSIEYKNGNDKFIEYLTKQILRKGVDGWVDSNSRYFDIIMNFDKTGKLIETTILSIDDTLIGLEFQKLIQQTQGDWINHTDSIQTLVLPVYWEFENDSGIAHKKINILKTDRYINGRLTKMTFLKPLEIKFIRGAR